MNTKKILSTFIFVLFIGFSAFAQRFAYVDSEYILKQVPEYNAAQKQLEGLSQQWQKDVDERYAAIERKYKAYQADRPMLSEEMRKRREDEIVKQEKETKDYQQKLFGYEGDLYQQRTKLIKPIQDRIAKAIQVVAQRQNLDAILDKGGAGAATFLYSNPSLDKSNDVIAELGYKPAALAK